MIVIALGVVATYFIVMEDIQYVKNRVSYIINEYGPGNSLFNTKDINRLLDQLGIEEQQNEMLIKECEFQQENLMHNEAELIPLREKCQRLQDNILVYQQQAGSDQLKIQELKEAINWALKYCKPERDELHCDFFNILTNAAQ